ncbi:hypothetical protein GCM10010185_32400 [Saccharothrix coeruleofusca]|uniref:Uncharacterized protein n=1 Tax=Saccharothrix coeruleofusca TaxID=33919 RepID=A0A918ALL5_9PSEU|nr:hypothetical protein GCM10010185_32400 [Saccharothrix coeruleofusca]
MVEEVKGGTEQLYAARYTDRVNQPGWPSSPASRTSGTPEFVVRAHPAAIRPGDTA